MTLSIPQAATPLAALPRRLRSWVMYLRVSDVGDRGSYLVSPELQERTIRKVTDKRTDLEPEPREIMLDLDLSGGIWDNRKVESIVQAIERRQIDLCYVARFDRFARDDDAMTAARRRVRKVGGEILSATQHFDNSADGWAAEKSSSIADQLFRMKIGEGYVAVHDRRRENGQPHSGIHHEGYRYTRADGYVIDPDNGPIIVEAYRRYIEGQGPREIHRWLRDVSGLTVPGTLKDGTADLWVLKVKGEPKGVMSTLDNGFAAGYFKHHPQGKDTPCPYCDGGQRDDRNQLIKAPKLCPGWVLRPGKHEPLISAALWEAYRAARAARVGAPRRELIAYRLTGLILCPDCEKPMSPKHCNGVAAERFICAHTFASTGRRAGACGFTGSMNRSVADATVKAWLIDNAPGDLERMARSEMPNRDAINTAAREKLDRALSAMVEQEQRVQDAFIDTGDRVERDRQTARLDARRAGFLADLAALPTPANLEARAAELAGLTRQWDLGRASEVNTLARKVLRLQVTATNEAHVRAEYDL